MQDELAAYSHLDVLVKILFLLTFPHFLHWKPKFLCWLLDEEEEGLDVKIAHEFDIEYLVDKLDGLYLDEGASSDGPAGFVGQQHPHKLRGWSCTQPIITASPSFLYSVSIIRATVRACSWDRNSYICTDARFSWIQSAKCSQSSKENRPSSSLSQTKRMPRCLKSKGKSSWACTSNISDRVISFLFLSIITRSYSSFMYSKMPGLSLHVLSVFPIII